MKYLYGASVQGIQGFIFATNRLREIVGASDIVEDIATDFFEKVLLRDMESSSYSEIIMAAGNIRLLFDKREDVERLFRIAPKKVMQKAYGITLSQAVVEVDGESVTRRDIDSLENLLKADRNRNSIALDASLNATYIAPRSARAASSTIKVQKDREIVDMATKQKDSAASVGRNRLLRSIGVESDEDLEKFPNDMSDMSNSKNKIAVIHVDGNGLGMTLQKIGETLEKRPELIKKVYSDFSKALDSATKEAAKRAYDESFFGKAKMKKIKFRPVVLGGDDLTVICDADRSLGFTERFLGYFEEETQKRIGSLGKKYGIDAIEEGLTACAGIAYCNEKFPFHYAVDLAEALCGEAKKHSKKLNEKHPPSSLMFHNIQSSWYESFADYKERELTIRPHGSDEAIGLDFGPYFLEKKEGYATIGDFREVAGAFMGDNTPIGKLRNWLDLLEESEELAALALERIDEMAKERGFDASSLKKLDPNLSLGHLVLEHGDERKTPIYDILQIHSISGVLQ